jgi:hypothetical protein
MVDDHSGVIDMTQSTAATVIVLPTRIAPAALRARNGGFARTPVSRARDQRRKTTAKADQQARQASARTMKKGVLRYAT